ncbi:MAG: histone deacetylase family protein [Spirochaetales bacterium]|nr:histone deacetylase family protein [Spirochaetales bacterium]
MFRIRKIYNTTLPVNKNAFEQIKVIIKQQFSHISDADVSELEDHLINPVRYRFQSNIFVAEDNRRTVKGFALLMYYPDLKFCFLNYISTAKTISGRGIGSALYERVREEARSLNAWSIFFECLPDDPSLCRDPEILKQNKKRLRFYERYGIFPIINTKYETPLEPGDDNPPYLMFDDLGKGKKLSRDIAKFIITAILERKYAGICPPSYINMVLDSIKDDPIKVREPRYIKTVDKIIPLYKIVPEDKRIALVVNDKHYIHHVKEKGYVESPVRIKQILEKLQQTDLFSLFPSKRFSEKYITGVHEKGFVAYLRTVCSTLPPGTSIYPYVFPIRNQAQPPKDMLYRAGYYCIDTFTPLNSNVYPAAKGAVESALTAAELVAEGYLLAYALVRPPGHHSEKKVFGGFCYFNSAAIAAEYLSKFGKVAMLDIDYHHGNGQQDIFYDRDDVLTISIHGHPQFAYPFFSGFKNEKGTGKGTGFNLNIPLAETIPVTEYKEAIERALKRIRKFSPDFLIILLGLDTARGDPTGTWDLNKKDFNEIGLTIGLLKIPVLVVQEGGYNTKNIGNNALHFFTGLWDGIY